MRPLSFPYRIDQTGRTAVVGEHTTHIGDARATDLAGAGMVNVGQLLRELGGLPPPDPAPDDPHDPIELSERREHLQAALGSLEPEDRLAAELYVIEGLPAEQVAGVLGLANAKAVYNRVYRILADLRARLEQSGIRPGDL